MQTKNVAIYYHGGCGGHFLNYFLLASGKYSTRYYLGDKKIDIEPGSLKKIRQQFYIQFNKENEWLSREMWPDNTDVDDASRLLLYCDGRADVPVKKSSFTIKICPYMENFHDWFRTVLYKRTNLFRNRPITLSLVKELYKKKLNRENTFSTKIPECDYYFEITQFVNNLETRKALCEFLSIPHTDLMEEFVAHYNECHKPLQDKTSW